MNKFPSIYLDFDRTLFNTDAFDKGVENLRNKYNISEQIWKKYRQQYRCDNNELYNASHIIYQICHEYDIDFNILNELREYIRLHSKDFIYEDAMNFLKKLENYNIKKYILTFGDIDYQGAKVYNTDITNYFDNIIITPEKKFTIPNIVDYENGIFVDDNPRDVEGLYLQNPYNVVRIRRPNVKYSDIDLKYEDVYELPSLDNVDIDQLILTRKRK